MILLTLPVVAYAWKSKDELLQQWDEQQSKVLPLPPIPELSCADEASLRLAQFRPIRRTPEDLKRLLEARADPNIVIPTETFGKLCPLEKILDARHAHVPIFFYARASCPIRLDILLPRSPVRYMTLSLYMHTCTHTR